MFYCFQNVLFVLHMIHLLQPNHIVKLEDFKGSVLRPHLIINKDNSAECAGSWKVNRANSLIIFLQKMRNTPFDNWASWYLHIEWLMEDAFVIWKWIACSSIRCLRRKLWRLFIIQIQVHLSGLILATNCLLKYHYSFTWHIFGPWFPAIVIGGHVRSQEKNFIIFTTLLSLKFQCDLGVLMLCYPENTFTELTSYEHGYKTGVYYGSFHAVNWIEHEKRSTRIDFCCPLKYNCQSWVQSSLPKHLKIPRKN